MNKISRRKKRGETKLNISVFIEFIGFCWTFLSALSLFSSPYLALYVILYSCELFLDDKPLFQFNCYHNFCVTCIYSEIKKNTILSLYRQFMEKRVATKRYFCNYLFSFIKDKFIFCVRWFDSNERIESAYVPNISKTIRSVLISRKFLIPLILFVDWH